MFPQTCFLHLFPPRWEDPGGPLHSAPVGVSEAPCMDLHLALSPALALPSLVAFKVWCPELPSSGPSSAGGSRVPPVHGKGLCLQQEFEGISAKARPWQGRRSVQHKAAFEPLQRPRLPLLPVSVSFGGGTQNGARRRAASGSGRPRPLAHGSGEEGALQGSCGRGCPHSSSHRTTGASRQHRSGSCSVQSSRKFLQILLVHFGFSFL